MKRNNTFLHLVLMDMTPSGIIAAINIEFELRHFENVPIEYSGELCNQHIVLEVVRFNSLKRMQLRVLNHFRGTSRSVRELVSF